MKFFWGIVFYEIFLEQKKNYENMFDKIILWKILIRFFRKNILRTFFFITLKNKCFFFMKNLNIFFFYRNVLFS